MEYKQPAIAEELRRRIASGIYPEMLPHTAVLAEEFGVNIKTMAKAIHQLAESGLVERRRRCGTRVVHTATEVSGGCLIEVIFEGFSTIFTHPYWGCIWDGLVSRLSRSGFRPVLNMLETDRVTGELDLRSFSLSPSAGKVILGIFDKRVFDAVRSSGVPFISASDPVDLPDVPQITFDFTYGLQKAVDFLADRGHRRIAFIGLNECAPPQILVKYPAYRRAMENAGLTEFIIVENVRPVNSLDAAVLERLLLHKKPDALIAAYDHQIPEMLKIMRNLSVDIPIIGCDGLPLEQLSSRRHSVKLPLNECGEAAARQLITAIRQHKPVASLVLPALFS